MSWVDNYRWSGWPGAYCLDCGCEDLMDYRVRGIAIPKNHPALRPWPCPCPKAGNYDPYRKGENG